MPQAPLKMMGPCTCVSAVIVAALRVGTQWPREANLPDFGGLGTSSPTCEEKGFTRTRPCQSIVTGTAAMAMRPLLLHLWRVHPDPMGP
jgi:hypothetical protein